MIGIFWPLATVAGWLSVVNRLGAERTRARLCPSSAWIWTSSAKFDASHPMPKPNGVAPASSEPSWAGKLAAVVGDPAPSVSEDTGPPGGAPFTSMTGPLEPVRGVHAPPQITPRDRASARDISTRRASIRTEGDARSIRSMNSLIRARFSGTSRTMTELVRWSVVNWPRGESMPAGLPSSFLTPPVIASSTPLSSCVVTMSVRKSIVETRLIPTWEYLSLKTSSVSGTSWSSSIFRLTSKSCRASAAARSCSASRRSASFRRCWISTSRCSALNAASASFVRFSSLSTRMMLPSWT